MRYVFARPLTVSVTVRATSTFVNPAEKTQNELKGGKHPSSTLTMTSTLAGSKNQNVPVSFVRPAAWPEPVRPSGVVHCAVTWNLPPPRQSVEAAVVQAAYSTS